MHWKNALRQQLICCHVRKGCSQSPPEGEIDAIGSGLRAI